MPYLQLRITFDPSSNRNAKSVFSLLRSFTRNWLVPAHANPEPPEYTAGQENLNKYGEQCDPHYHLNAYFDPPDLKDPLRSAKNWLRKNAISRDFTLKGNKIWSCTLVEEPKDYDRWIRYPLKEAPVPALTSISGERLKQLHLLAYEERKRSVEINVMKREKAVDKISLKDKLFKHLSGLDPQGHQDIWLAILNYYTQEGKAINFQTINGYTILYQLHIKEITPLQAYVMRSNPQ